MSVASFVAAQRTDHGVPHATVPGPRGLSVVVLQVAGPPADAAPDSGGPTSTPRCATPSTPPAAVTGRRGCSPIW